MAKYGRVYCCDHPVYHWCTLYEINNKGLAVIQQYYNEETKSTSWRPIFEYLQDELYLHPKFKEFFDKRAGEPDKNGQFKVISKIDLMKPQQVCTFSYFTIGNFDDQVYAKNLLYYLSSKFVRFLLLQSISSINISKDKFKFVPIQDFSKPWTDEELYKKYNLTSEEIEFIESMIKPMDLGSDVNG